MLFLECNLRFTTSLDLSSSAALISERLFGGLRFVETDEFDEIPGVRLEKDLMMLSPRICGQPPHYALIISTNLPVYPAADFPRLEYVKIGELIKKALEPIEQIKILD